MAKGSRPQDGPMAVKHGVGTGVIAGVGLIAVTLSGASNTASLAATRGRAATVKPLALPPPRSVRLPMRPALSGEGEWQTVGPPAGARPAMYATAFQADVNYPDEVSYAVWMDPKLLRLELVAGSAQPGGTWQHPPYVTGSELPRLVAAFNGGFQFRPGDARGGFYLDGTTAVPLVTGAASLVIYKGGGVDVGTWGTDVTMTPDVQAVLQNVVLLVDRGQIAQSATYTDNSYWGFTLGGGAIVPRSGIGVTSDGALVYVGGPAMTARSLAESLQRAGAVRAMTLDINPWWVTFNFYSHGSSSPSELTGSKLYPYMQRSPDRYLPPVLEERDFIEVLQP